VLKLINIELYKQLKVKTLVIAALLAVLCIIVCYRVNSTYEGNVYSSRKELVNKIDAIDMKLTSLKDYSESMKSKGELETYESIKLQIAEEEKKQTDLQTKLASLSDKYKKLNIDLNMLKDNIDKGSTDGFNPKDTLLEGSAVDKGSLQIKNYERLTAYKETGIVPDEMKLTATKFLNTFSEEISPLFLLIVVTLLVADIVSVEHSEGTMRLYLSQPLSKTEVFISKYVASIISSVILVLGVQFIFFIATGVLNGWGPLNSPTEYGASFILKDSIPAYAAGSQSLIPAYSFILYYALLEILYIAALASGAFFMSSLFTKSTLSLTTGCCFSMVLYYIFISTKKPVPLQQYAYISYGDIWAVLSGNLQQIKSSLCLSNCIIVFIATSLLFAIASFFIFRRKEVYS